MPQTDITKVGVKWWTWDFSELNDHVFKEKINLKIKNIENGVEELKNCPLQKKLELKYQNWLNASLDYFEVRYGFQVQADFHDENLPRP